MKKNIALPVLAILAIGITFSSCKKTNDTQAESATEEIANTTDMAGKESISDNITEDANNVFMNVANTNGVMGGRLAARPQSPDDTCGVVTITPAIGFPKTIVIDFGSGCVSHNGMITRSGKINIVIDTLVRVPGSKAVMTFTNYIVNGFKTEGTITWTNTSTASVRSWQRKVENGKTTNTADGKYWYHSGIKNVVQTEGVATRLDLSDDVFSITGTHTVTNMNNRTRTCTIDDSNPLIKANTCPFISKGSVKIQGPNHYAVIDYGDGTCDNQATISIDGSNPTSFTLH